LQSAAGKLKTNRVASEQFCKRRQLISHAARFPAEWRFVEEQIGESASAAAAAANAVDTYAKQNYRRGVCTAVFISVTSESAVFGALQFYKLVQTSNAVFEIHLHANVAEEKLHISDPVF
jgi:hypothetical protein